MNPVQYLADVLHAILRGLEVIWTHTAQPMLVWMWHNPKSALVALIIVVVALIAIYAGGSSDRTHGPQ